MYEAAIEYSNATGDAFLNRTVDAMTALSEAVKDGGCKIIYEIVDESRAVYHVYLLDEDVWGSGPDLDTALRYALGAHFHAEAIS